MNVCRPGMESRVGKLLSEAQTLNRQHLNQGSSYVKANGLKAKAKLDLAFVMFHSAHSNEIGLQIHHPHMLLELGSVQTNLEMFAEAKSTFMQALDLCNRLFGKDSAETASCNTYIANLCRLYAMALVKDASQLSTESAWMSPNSILALSSRVVVGGLSSHPQYNGLEGVVITTVTDSRIGIRLDEGNKRIRLKLENVHPHLATAPIFATGLNFQKSVCILFWIARSIKKIIIELCACKGVYNQLIFFHIEIVQFDLYTFILVYTCTYKCI